MKLLITGATGFVGRHVVTRALERGHSVRVVTRAPERARDLPWASNVEIVRCDLHDNPNVQALVHDVQALIHLAWPGLPNYKGRFHFELNLLQDYNFLCAAVESGLSQLVVTGTCLEYGMQSGAIGEDAPTNPGLAYPLAKDTLHRFLQLLALEKQFVLQWARLFYVYGPGQNPKSLLMQLDQAIERGASSFDMSGGEQLRDFIHVREVANILVRLAERPDVQGAINCCSGRPVAVRSMVEAHLAQRGADMRLNLGVYPYPDYEPMAFWGSSHKLALLDSPPSK